MKRKQVAIFYLLALLFVCAGLGCLPLIPIRVAPVVPHPIYRLTFVSLVGMIWRLGLVGVGGWGVQPHRGDSEQQRERGKGQWFAE